jgi:uncharacterized glyoxalase superfamily protein PhnB
MDFEEYRKKHFTDPVPVPRYQLHGIHGATLYYQDYQGALSFFRKVFGSPAYVEGENTHGWKIGNSWLTVFPARQGSPQNLEIPVYLQTAEEVDRLYTAFIDAGAHGTKPEDTLMYHRVRMAIVTDPFGAVFNLVYEYGE